MSAYSYDNNGRVVSITDGRGYQWTKTYDALGRMATLTTPAGGSGSHTHRIWYDGNGDILKTQDFKVTSHYYAYDSLNRMTGTGRRSTPTTRPTPGSAARGWGRSPTRWARLA